MSRDQATSACVVMLSRDHWRFTERALRSLASTVQIDFETVVVDNGSQPEVLRALRRLETSPLGRALRLRCHFNERNCGVASGRNIGAALTAAEVLVFLDNDTEINDPLWLRYLMDAQWANADFGVIGGVLLNADRSSSVQFSGGRVAPQGQVYFEQDLRPDLGASLRQADFALGACLSTKRSVFVAAGGFDAIFDPMDYEDVDYCLRVSAVDRPTAIETRSKLVHYGHVTTQGSDFGRLRNYLINGRVFANRWDQRLRGAIDQCSPRLGAR